MAEESRLRHCPAPLICHLTDGEYTDADPLPIVDRIRQMRFPDGAVLVENVIFDNSALCRPIENPYDWGGVAEADELATAVAKHLFDMSSPIPASYLNLFADRGYNMRPDARLLFSGDTPEMIEAAFTMSAMTPTIS